MVRAGDAVLERRSERELEEGTRRGKKAGRQERAAKETWALEVLRAVRRREVRWSASETCVRGGDQLAAQAVQYEGIYLC